MGLKDILEFGSAVAKRMSEDPAHMQRVANLLLTSNLSPEDRAVLFESRKKTRQYLQTGASLGLLLGIGTSIFLIRRSGIAYRNLRRMQTSGATVRFADGREELISNLSPAVRPSFAKNAITFGMLSMGGYIFGGMVGSSFGEQALREYQAMHPDAMKRIRAYERQSMVAILKHAAKAAEELDAERSDREGVSSLSRREGGGGGAGFDSWPPPDNPPPEFPRSF
ncbi:hypothetical protein TWF481_004169 [Arthrobotrys musiformis]|uniref:Uncharacterized protein n=1 Tax=Arthrobotrys musiformis TaxID=47236 RepID=A0AAV9WKS8_9PEZI